MAGKKGNQGTEDQEPEWGSFTASGDVSEEVPDDLWEDEDQEPEEGDPEVVDEGDSDEESEGEVEEEGE